MNSIPAAPSRRFTLCLFALAGIVLALLLVRALGGGSSFDEFPDRIIGISLLSDVDPHFRITVFLLTSALGIVAATALFTLEGMWRLRLPEIRLSETTAILAACAVANVVAALFHPDQALFSAAALLCVVLLGTWQWHVRMGAYAGARGWALRLAMAWQGTTLLLWLTGLPGTALVFGIIALALFLTLGKLLQRQLAAGMDRWIVALVAWLALAPLLLIVATELAYFHKGTAVQSSDSLLLFAALSLVCLFGASLRPAGEKQLVKLALAGVLLSTFIVNQYENEILYRGYDLFHLAEKMLPLQQWDDFRSLPFRDYHPGHGLFDLFPHGVYHLLNGGEPLESALWGNGYFQGWVFQTLYIGLLFACLAPVAGAVSAFLLLFLLPVFHVLEPYNALLMLPILRLLRLPAYRNLLLWWTVQWSLALLLTLWRPDFGLVVAAGYLVVMGALSWSRWDIAHVAAGLAGAVIAIAGIVATVLALSAGEAVIWFVGRWAEFIDIQMLTASYDAFYREWNYLATIQYVVMPLVGVLAGGYSLAQVYLRRDPQALAIHLVVIFATAIGFALSIRLFQRHSLVEGFTKTNFFYFAALFAFLSLRLPNAWRGLGAVGLIMLTFLLTPKSGNYLEKSAWSPRRSYPPVTHDLSMPALARQEPRLEDRVTRYDAFEKFAKHYLGPGDAFYDFSNAPMLYMLARVKLPIYHNETVYHTSEKMQDFTLGELDSLYSDGKLPFVVFRRNKPRWDALDGVDNALRSYKMAEYIYRHYSPCIGVSNLDIWLDKRMDCRDSLAQRLPQEVLESGQLTYLRPHYLQQEIAFGHLPFIWANFDTHQESLGPPLPLAVRAQGESGVTLSGLREEHCANIACYLDLEIDSTVAQRATLYFGNREQLSFALRPGRHAYRLRVSALWRWHQQINRRELKVEFSDRAAEFKSAELVEIVDG